MSADKKRQCKKYYSLVVQKFFVTAVAQIDNGYLRYNFSI